MKKYLLSFLLGWVSASYLAQKALEIQDQKYNRLLKHSKLNFEVIKKYANASPPELNKQIHEEVEFDYLVLRLDDVDSSKMV